MRKLLHLALLVCFAEVALAEELRPQDGRTFTPVIESGFDALSGAVATDRWTGVLDGAAYRIEVPKANWNGQLVMWAHGYAGTGSRLTVSNPLMRRYLLQNGYAWAASSYSKNFYDVRAGIEDTNNLALHFVAIAAENGRVLAKPTKTFIAGVSMGGHVTAAAVDREVQRDANHNVFYNGAVPLCGVVGDTELFNYLGSYQVAAQQLAGVPMEAFPVNDFAKLAPIIQAALWSNFPTQTNSQGDLLKNAVKYLSGGERPLFDAGWANAGNQKSIWGSIGADGTLDGILNANIVDTRGSFYKIDASSGASTSLDAAFNGSIFKIEAAADANPLRADGLRWVPLVHADLSVPVVSLHTLGDLYVPFKMEQVFAERAKARGTDQWLVQWAIRDVGHCAFTAAEAAAAFDAMVKWEAGGAKPAGDDVTTAATVARSTFGCAFTRNEFSAEDYTSASVRAGYPACP